MKLTFISSNWEQEREIASLIEKMWRESLIFIHTSGSVAPGELLTVGYSLPAFVFTTGQRCLQGGRMLLDRLDGESE